MNIGYDGSKAINESAGIGTYTKQIITNMVKLFPKDNFFVYFNFLRGSKNKKKAIFDMFKGTKNVKSSVIALPGWIKERLYYSFIHISSLWLPKIDIFHAAEFLNFDNNLKVPQILTVHDLSMIKFPAHKGSSESRWNAKILKKSCINADAIISISEATKQDIIKYFDIDPNKITVVYSGVDENYRNISNKNIVKNYLKKKYKINFPYLLFVSTIEPRKNIDKLFLAFDKFKESDKNNYHLIVVGKWGWNTQKIEKIYNKMRYKNYVIFTSFTPIKDIVYLYNGASLFCYPSLYEGFGLPILEAMNCGAPVLTSNISSMPEVGGDAAYYINPNNYKDILTGIKKILGNRQISENMTKKGFIQAKKFSWKKTVINTHKIYQKVIDEKK